MEHCTSCSVKTVSAVKVGKRMPVITAVLLRAVKSGVNLPLTKISAIFKVHLDLFLLTQFFITHLTLPAFVCLLGLVLKIKVAQSDVIM